RDQGFLSDALLRKAVRSVSESDDRYDWAGAFLVREDGENLWVHNYVGDPGEYAEIAVGSGVWGEAVAKRENRRVDDPSAVDEYPPPISDIQSDVVVLIRAGSEICGGLVVGSEQTGVFGDEDEAALVAVAEKLAEQIAAERR